MPDALPHRPEERASSTRTYVADSPYGGRGVFALEAIAAGEVVEVCPVVVVPCDAIEHLERTTLGDHWYGWGEDGDAAMALGHGSFYNHQADPTCDYEVHELVDALVMTARRDVPPGGELTIDYTGGGVNELWFDPT